MKNIKEVKCIRIAAIVITIIFVVVIFFFIYYSNNKNEKTSIQDSDTIVIEYAEEDQEMHFRDRNEEKKESLEGSTLAQSADDIINEDYLPKLNLSGEELRLYIQKIFLDICREPDKIEKYHDIFSEESINRFKEIEWKYYNAKEFYDVSIGTMPEKDNNDTIYGSVDVDSKYAVWELDLEEGAEGKWAYGAFYIYFPKNGMIEIEENYLYISLY